jgi:hypothetical protein
MKEFYSKKEIIFEELYQLYQTKIKSFSNAHDTCIDEIQNGPLSLLKKMRLLQILKHW